MCFILYIYICNACTIGEIVYYFLYCPKQTLLFIILIDPCIKIEDSLHDSWSEWRIGRNNPLCVRIMGGLLWKDVVKLTWQKLEPKQDVIKRKLLNCYMRQSKLCYSCWILFQLHKLSIINFIAHKIIENKSHQV